ncbi:hypothetical protein [Ahrensia sp. 13_GOM-1096m]|uniref:hypothetical protein n=1 Tax=Ahrensia sp. 13_GOM-1096m TaxID=1380380 RepID=UPI00047B785C|nr:hypothetical protein [Ahrensia sp. 13_GOM-1096m]
MVRLSEEEAAALDSVRGKRSRPEWLRLQLQTAVPSLDVAPEPKKKKPSFRFNKQDASLNNELLTANINVARNTGAIIQLAKAVRIHGNAPSLHADIEGHLSAGKKVLAEIQSALRSAEEAQ